MNFSLKEVLTIGAFVAGIAGAWGVTIHKVESFDTRLKRVEGNIQFLIGTYIRDGRGDAPAQVWVQPDYSRIPIPPDVLDAPGS